MKVIVTRPRLEADAWVKQLQALHMEAVALPLIHIGAAADTAQVAKAWGSLHQYSAAMFVSSNAVRYFFSSNLPTNALLNDSVAIKNIANLHKITPKVRFWATGPGTRDALLSQTVPPDCIDSPTVDATQYDSEALWHIVKNQVKAGDKVLMVRGSSVNAAGAAINGRPWLAEQLSAAGVQVDTVISYQRSTPKFDEAELALISQASSDHSIWLFSSSEAAANLRAVSGVDWSSARAIATHPRIAQATRDAGFGVVYESRPLLADVAALAASIESKL